MEKIDIGQLGMEYIGEPPVQTIRFNSVEATRQLAEKINEIIEKLNTPIETVEGNQASGGING